MHFSVFNFFITSFFFIFSNIHTYIHTYIHICMYVCISIIILMSETNLKLDYQKKKKTNRSFNFFKHTDTDI